MLELKNIVKRYSAGDGEVQALKGVTLRFRNSEFVSILGPSGCGKTTMLNIIGGLDKYSEGDLVINGRSTRSYKDRDWDSYRNHSVGFVFQSYNLIPHQSVLQNVELALSLSGVGKKERRKRATEALKRVGLGDQLRKKPGEMSGGQMQRVAIARAIVNDPDIILADEPTGALDSQTSLQVMEILKEISAERLVVMVTHNPELANDYSTRIVRMLDGEVIDDSCPVSDEELECALASAKQVSKDIPKYSKTPIKIKQKKQKKPSMSIFTAFGLSLKNLFTKKGRTALTSFAGSIGIIGIALILAVSQGMTNYINTVQEDTLSSYPLTLEAQHMDLGSFMQSFISSAVSDSDHDNDAVYQKPVVYDMVNALANIELQENDLAAFKSYIETQLKDKESKLYEALNGVSYSYNFDMLIYTKAVDGNIVLSDSQALMRDMLIKHFGQSMSNGSQTGAGNGSMMSMMSMGGQSLGLWQELLAGENGPINPLLEKQYDMVKGEWPDEYNEIVLVLDKNNELDDMTLFALGLTSREEMEKVIDAAFNKEKLEVSVKKWSYEDILNMEFRTVLNADCFVEEKINGVSTGRYTDLRQTDAGMRILYDNAVTLKVTGIIRPKEEAVSAMLTGSIGYTNLLTKYVLDKNATASAVIAQKNDPSLDIFSGLPFKENTENLSPERKQADLKAYITRLDTAARAETYVTIKSYMKDDAVSAAVKQMLATTDEATVKNIVLGAISAQTGMSGEELEEYLSKMNKEDYDAIVEQILGAVVRAQYADGVKKQLGQMEPEMLASLLMSELDTYSVADCDSYYDIVMKFSSTTYRKNLETLGSIDIHEPDLINLYAATFAQKDVIEQVISDYNASVPEGQKIHYTDYVGIMMASVTTIIDAITYVLISFVAVSLIVSSIMIGVITLISVQERTKEIGILRAIGASKRNVANMFTAETAIIGFTSGLLGVGVTYALCVPINIILQALTGIKGLGAYLPPEAAVLLVIISVALTLFSGIIPSGSAAKKDPVVALRSE